MTDPLLIADREDTLRAEVHDVRAPQFRRLLDECERYRTIALPEEHPLASITYIGAASANLALAHRLTGQQHYLDELRRWVATAVSFPHWGRANMPDHDLDAGWLLHGLGLAYSWAGDALEADERAALRDKLVLQGTRLYEFAVESEGGWWSSSYWQNHNWICYAGLATAGYAVQAEHPAARGWTERAKGNFRTVLEMLPEDGSNNEGVVYWRYGVPWLVSYLDVLKAQEGIDWFATSDYLRETFWYRLYQAAPDMERIVDHGDCHDRRSGHPVAMYYKLASEYRIPQCQWLADKVAGEFFWREAYESGVRPGVRAEAYQELLWFDPTAPSQGPQELPTSRYFADLGLVVGRTSWEADAVMVSFKASPGGGHKAWETSHRIARETGWTTLNAGHHHPDAGTFVLLGHGAYLALDEGYSSRKRTEHHNAVLVDGHGFVNEDRYHVFENLAHEYEAHVVTTTLADGWVHAVSETSAMYDRDLGVTRARRHVVLTPGGSLVVLDDLRATSPRAWTWLLQTENPARPDGAGRWLAEAGSGSMRVTALDDVDDVLVHPTPVHANPTSSTPSLAIEKVQHTIRRTSAPTSTTRFLTVLEPRAWDDLDPAEITTHETDGGVVVRITRGGTTEEVELSLEPVEDDVDGRTTGPGFAGRVVTAAVSGARA
ncbi:uncharacterized protein DUF4962 [Sediminihabitans luteus]|uniref:Uncharacterized protein DUF4962 n=1 Tax=Sediminihabitans luteus TaxID=1138585 RepID=A0A2M9D171_9CELL|nr:DUF4962 domain-containing protein [Sediminihabitans luteus]PJJ77956.1 uncharacterized protein DUF4962 [Sediminihabitans luteus]GIJ00585.1 hypothetical protein Slu03_29620 [Sediminihabitans luteus]